MKIKRLVIGKFGRLSDVTLDFNDKITVLYGDNEAGKSTIVGFIKFMLYGFPKRGSQSVEENDRLHFTPWDGSVAYGQMEIETANGSWLIERYADKRGTKVLDLLSGKVLDTGSAELGELLMGIDSASFERTMLASQRGLTVTQNDGLHSKIGSLVTTSDEAVSYEKAMNALEAARSKIVPRRGKGGLLAEAEEKAESFRNEFIEARNRQQGAARIAEQMKICETTIANLQQKYDANALQYKASTAKRAIARLNELEQAKKELAEVEKQLDEQRGELTRGEFTADSSYPTHLKALIGEYDSEAIRHGEAEKQAITAEDYAKDAAVKYAELNEELIRETEAKYEQIAKKSKNTSTALIILAVVCFVLAAAGACVAVFFVQSLMMILLCASAGAAVIGAIMLVLGLAAKKKPGKFLAGEGYESIEKLKAEIAENERAQALLQSINERAAQAREAEQNAAQVLAEREEKVLYSAKQWDSEIDSVDGARKATQELADRMNKINELKNKLVLHKTYLARLYGGADPKAVEQELRDAAAGYKLEDDGGESDIAQLEVQKERLTIRLNEENRKLSDLKVSMAAERASDPAEAFEKAQYWLAKVAELQVRYNALTAAMAEIKAAYDGIHKQFAPQLNSRTEEILAQFSGEKYGELSVNDLFGIELQKDSARHDLAYFSHGTRDMVSLAMRLALCDLLFGQEYPVVLDSSFDSVDEQRLYNSLRLIDSVDHISQVIILTCHDREKTALKKLGCEFDTIKL